MTMLDIFRGLKGLTKSQSVGRSSLWKRGLRESFSGHDRQLNFSTALLSNSHLPPRLLPHSHHSTVSCSKYEAKRTPFDLFQVRRKSYRLRSHKRHPRRCPQHLLLDSLHIHHSKVDMSLHKFTLCDL